MIDPEKFLPLWQMLCKRFSREVDTDEAMAYLQFMDDAGLTDEQMESALRAQYATARFFPRPADFLGPEATRAWIAVLDWASKWSPQLDGEFAARLFNRIPARGHEALRALGGIDAVRMSRDPMRVRAAFIEAFDAVVAEQVATRHELPQLQGAQSWPGLSVIPADGPQVFEWNDVQPLRQLHGEEREQFLSFVPAKARQAGLSRVQIGLHREGEDDKAE